MKLWRDLEQDEMIQEGDRYADYPIEGRFRYQVIFKGDLFINKTCSAAGGCFQRPVEFQDNAITPVDRVKTVPQDEVELWKDVYTTLFLRLCEIDGNKKAMEYACRAAQKAVQDLRTFKDGGAQ